MDGHQSPNWGRRDAAAADHSERSNKRPRLDSKSSDGLLREVGVMRQGLGQSSASFVGSASGIHFIRAVYGAVANADSRNESESSTAEDNVVPGEDDRLQPGSTSTASKPLWQDYEVDITSKDLVSATFSFEDLAEWTRSYFDHWHPCFPLLHAPSVLAYLEDLSQIPRRTLNDEQVFDIAIAKALISISIADNRQSGLRFKRSVPSCLVFISYDESIESVQGALLKPATLKSLQAAVCSQLFLVSMLRHNAASRLAGLIVRMAFQLGLHRCPARFPTFSSEETQLRQRLFWSIYCIDRHICQSIGLPLTIRDDDVDVCYPDKEYHRGHHDLDAGPDERLRLLTYIAKMASIKGLIMELRNKSVLHSQADPDEAVLINAKLSKWWNEIEDYIDSGESTNSLLSPIHAMTLKVLRHESVIALNRPILSSSKSTPSYSAALQTCIGASKAIISTLRSSLLATETTASEREPPRALLWPSFTWAVWMSAFILMFAAAEDQVDKQVALRLTERSLDVLQHLSSRGSVWPNACAVAIRDLRTKLLQTEQQPQIATNPVTSSPSTIVEPSNERGSRKRGDPNPNVPSGRKSRRGNNDNPSGSSKQAADPPIRSNVRKQTTVDNLPDYVPPEISNRNGQSGSLNPAESVSNVAAQPFNYAQPVLSSLVADNWTEMGQLYDSFDPLGTVADINDPFQGFDIPFWMGEDRYTDLIGSWNS